MVGKGRDQGLRQAEVGEGGHGCATGFVNRQSEAPKVRCVVVLPGAGDSAALG